MIDGAHVILSSRDPEADRAFLRDVLGLPHVDVGEGWLIFALPPAEVAVHPSERNDAHELYLMCGDVRALVAAWAARGSACDPVQDLGWGLLTRVTLPGGGRLGVYQPRHARPAPVAGAVPGAADDSDGKARLWRQFGAAIDMLENAVVACPESLWGDRTRRPEFWYVVYHTLFWLDLYLSGSAEGFVPPAPFTLDELDPAGLMPERVYAKAELRAYLRHGREKCRGAIAASTPASAPAARVPLGRGRWRRTVPLQPAPRAASRGPAQPPPAPGHRFGAPMGRDDDAGGGRGVRARGADRRGHGGAGGCARSGEKSPRVWAGSLGPGGLPALAKESSLLVAPAHSGRGAVRGERWTLDVVRVRQ